MRLCAANYFLTYPQCTLSKEELLEFLNEKLKNLTYYVISQEVHEDGNLHLHALVCLASRLDIRSERYFDVGGFHPNIQATRNKEASKTYIKKDGNFIESTIQPETNPNLTNPYEWDQDLNEQQFYAKGLDSKVPFQYTHHAWQLRSKPNLTLTNQEVNINFMSETLQKFEWDWTRNQSLVISGKSGVGKSTWVKWKAPKPALWVTHIDDLRHYREGFHQSIIFDDMSFGHIPREAQIHLVDTFDSRSIHVRYGTVFLPAGIPRVFTTNLRTPFSEDDAIARRISINLFN